MVPQSSIEHAPSSGIIKIRPGPYSDIFCALLSEQGTVISSARALLAPPRSRKLVSDATIEEGE